MPRFPEINENGEFVSPRVKASLDATYVSVNEDGELVLGGEVIPTGPPLDSVDAVIAALDYRAPRPIVIAQCSDSTGDQDNEWFELSFKAAFAALWPDRAVNLRRWNKDASTFYSTIQWQTGIFQSFLAALFAVWEPCPVVVTSQNPEFGTGKQAAHKTWMLALREYARSKGWGYIPTYEAFMSLPDGGASEIPDGLHPGIGTGRTRQAATALAWIKSKSRRPVTVT